jgi:glycosyltransferase involved in cell wall biosynthesis
MRRDVASADYAIYVTKKYLQRVYPCTGEVATASNVELVKRSSPNLKDERALKTFKIGFVGDVGLKEKGFDWMLQAIHQFAEQLDVRVLVAIAGTPVQRFNGDIYEDLEERVLLDNLGLLDPKTALIDFYRSLDVLVSASFSEGLPRIVIEAMSQGVPCIATSVGGTAELFHGVESLLIEPLDNSGLIRALEKVLLDNNFHRRCSLQVFENTAHYEKSRLSEVRQAFWSSFEDYVRSRC